MDFDFDYKGIFTYDDAVKVYKKQDSYCHDPGNKQSNECLPGSYCGYHNQTIGKCIFSAYCLEDDLNTCAMDKVLRVQCKNDDNCSTDFNEKNIECLVNEDCLSNKCSNTTCIGRTYIAMMYENQASYGLDDGEKCTRDKQCMFGDCRKGVCGPPNPFKIPNMIGIGILLFFLICILGCILCSCNLFRKGNKNENK